MATIGRERVRVAVLMGGPSSERDVSLASGDAVCRALDPERFDTRRLEITKEGRWLAPRRVDALPAPATEPEPTDAAHALAAQGGERPYDVALLALHGAFGEDGTVQGLLELGDVAYVGTGVLGSALNMDKATAKVVAQAAGIPVCRWLSARDSELDDAFIARVGAELGWPVFVKPSNMGSSVGVSRADDPAALRAALAEAVRYDEWVVVEEAVDARELEVGVIGNEAPRASVVGEIVPTHEFYDYEDKYVDGAAEMVIPADVPTEVAEQMRELAVQVYRALRCDGLSRVDFFYEAGEGGRGLLFNEINTMPGFTKYSMFPALWDATGLPYAELIDELVRLALARHQHRSPHRRLR